MNNVVYVCLSFVDVVYQFHCSSLEYQKKKGNKFVSENDSTSSVGTSVSRSKKGSSDLYITFNASFISY